MWLESSSVTSPITGHTYDLVSMKIVASHRGARDSFEMAPLSGAATGRDSFYMEQMKLWLHINYNDGCLVHHSIRDHVVTERGVRSNYVSSPNPKGSFRLEAASAMARRAEIGQRANNYTY